MKRILGIDPGSRMTGIGIIDVGPSSKLIHIFHTHISLQQQQFASRLVALYAAIRDVVECYQPHEIAIEQVFVHHNASSALKLGQARGVAIAAAAADQLPFFEYAPRVVKQTVTGLGSAQKSQVEYVVRALLGLSDQLQADAADALAIALTHAHSDFIVAKPRGRRSRGLNWSQYDRKLAGKINRG